MELTEFLLARIAEDEEVAKAATPGPWRWDGDREKDEADLWGQPEGDDEYANPVITASGMHTEGYIHVTEPDAEHIARHDPARVLTECDAKRRIVKWALEHPKTCDEAHPQADVYHADGHGPHDIALVLALPHADHPDYRDEWRP